MLEVHPGATDLDRSADRRWLHNALLRLEQESDSCNETAMHRFPLPGDWGVDLYIKDESRHPTGSLKHRLARSLILYGLCNGLIHETTTLIDASSGSTAVSEAYFAKLLGLPFVAVVPRSTSLEKVSLIESAGGRCHFVTETADMQDVARQLAEQPGGHFLDQFTNAERATDWRGNNNIAESIFDQLVDEAHPIPRWIVCGAGTGGTTATIGRYVRYRRHDTRVMVVDPEGSAFFEGWSETRAATAIGSDIEGIGRPRVEPSFVPGVVDRMMRITNAESVAGVRLLAESTDLAAGPSTGTALVGAIRLAHEMATNGTPGSVVSLLCDRGDRYSDTYNDDDWLQQRGWQWQPELDRLRTLLAC